MANVAVVEDGKIVETESQTSLAKTQKKDGSKLDKEAFLQLLVAQMKYQDPLEPTSNTEYISQFATFSELEQMQNMSASMDLSRASSLVGQTVYMRTTQSDGSSGYVEGKVDYVYYENGKAYLAINEELYSLDDLDTVVDKSYYDAFNKGMALALSINKLPSLKNLTLAEREKVEEIYKTYNNMNEYEKSFIASTYTKLIDQYYEKMQQLIKAAEEAAESEKTDESTESTDKTEETDSTEGTESTTGTE